MTTPEKAQVALMMASWLFLFQFMGAMIYFNIKRTLKQLQNSREKKAGYERCQEIFHCHCEKKNDGHSKHVNETNMVVWE
jgi:hypothetical protein